MNGRFIVYQDNLSKIVYRHEALLRRSSDKEKRSSSSE